MSEDAPAIDSAVIEQLREIERGGSPGFVAELAGLYLSQGEQQMGVMADCLSRRDEAPFCAAAHLMKGSSGNIGALALMKLFKELEGAARQKSWAVADGLFGRVSSEFARVREALRALQRG